MTVVEARERRRLCERLAAAIAARTGRAPALDAPLGALTTYRVGGAAAVLVDLETEEDLVGLHGALAGTPGAALLPLLVLGKGSNLLVADGGFAGLVVRLHGELAGISLPSPGSDGDRLVVRAGGGCGMPVLARRAAEAGLRGLEWAVGIPGSVGGALKMNAGGHGSDTAACLVRYRCFDLAGGGAGEWGPEQLALGYRTSSLASSEVVVWAELAVRRGDAHEARAQIADIVRWRREHQPGGSNAGSVFVNPPGDSAGRLVEASGLKGFRMGSARVSEKHANFIQADEGGSAADVLALMLHARRAVEEASGVRMRPEVRLVGFEPDPFAPGRAGDATPVGEATARRTAGSETWGPGGGIPGAGIPGAER